MPPKTFRETYDVAYCRKLPGIIIILQLVCSFLGFITAATTRYRVTGGHWFFLFVTFSAVITNSCWLVANICRVKEIGKFHINWTIVGLVHNTLGAFFLMVASCVMVDMAAQSRALRAAGVFGFLAFSACLVGLACEFTRWHRNSAMGPGLTSATVVKGMDISENSSKGQWSPEVPEPYPVAPVVIRTRQSNESLNKNTNDGTTDPMLASAGHEPAHFNRPLSEDSFDSDTSTAEATWSP